MPKATTQFVCAECGYTSPKWLGRCPDCGNTVEMEEPLSYDELTAQVVDIWNREYDEWWE